MPYFATLLWELGFEVVRSGPTNQKTVDAGSRALLVESCFPIKAALGHAGLLADKGLPLFIPSFVLGFLIHFSVMFLFVQGIFYTTNTYNAGEISGSSTTMMAGVPSSRCSVRWNR